MLTDYAVYGSEAVGSGEEGEGAVLLVAELDGDADLASMHLT